MFWSQAMHSLSSLAFHNQDSQDSNKHDHRYHNDTASLFYTNDLADLAKAAYGHKSCQTQDHTCVVAINTGHLTSFTQSIACNPPLTDRNELLHSQTNRVGRVRVCSSDQTIHLREGQGWIGRIDSCCGAYGVRTAGLKQGACLVCLQCTAAHSKTSNYVNTAFAEGQIQYIYIS